MKTLRRTLFLLTFINIFIFSCSGPSQEFVFDGELILLDSNNVPSVDTKQEYIISQYRESLDAEMNRLLVYSEMVMERGTPEGKLNNFVADLVLQKGIKLYNPDDEKPIDFCLLNYGGLRVPLPQGEITYSRVYELLPFENEMVVVTLTGEKTAELFHYLATSERGMPVSGIELVVENDTPVQVSIQGKEFDLNRNYKVLTSDYLAEGGDNMIFFLQPLNYELLGLRVRDAIIKHMENKHARGEKISSALDGRITVR